MEKKICPHCEKQMNRWLLPSDSSWDADFFWVCFNDDCPYFKRGWIWMMEKYNVKASYRYRIHPVSGKEGSLPVGSIDALKDSIINDEVGNA
jgi:hypothetical protein